MGKATQPNPAKLSKIDRYFSVPERAINFVAGLHVSYVVADFQFQVLTSLLTRKWNLSLLDAVCITNIQEGLKKLLVVLSAILADTFLGCSMLLLISASFYCAGLYVWHFSVPDDTESRILRLWIYLSLAFITLGQCGYDNYKERGEAEEDDNKRNVDSSDQVKDGRVGKQALEQNSEQERESKLRGWKKIGCFCKRFTIAVLKKLSYELIVNLFKIIGLAIAIGIYLNNLDIAVMLGVSSAFFLIGKLCFYPFERLEKTPLSLLFRVFYVTIRRRRYNLCGSCKYFKGANDSGIDDLESGIDHNGDDPDNDNQNSESPNSSNVEDLGEQSQTSFSLDNNNSVHEFSVEDEDTADLVDDQSAEDSVDDSQDEILEGNDDDRKLNLELLNHRDGDDRTEQILDSNVDHDDELLMQHNDSARANGEDNYHRQNAELDDDSENHNQATETRSGLGKKLRCFNRAALYNKKTEDPKTEFEKGRLCTVKQVQETKQFIRVTRLSLIFLMYGIMEAVSSTFFVEQAFQMDTEIWTFDVPVQFIMYSSSVTEYLVSSVCKWYLAKYGHQEKRTRFHGAVRIGLGLFLSVPCFVTACFVEQRRLTDLNHKQETSAFWLIPQYSLMGAMKGLVVADDFFNEELPKSFSRSSYGSIFSDSIIGIGQILSLIVLVVVYYTSQIGDNSGWIGFDINSSHVDHYYAVMAVFGSFCCIIHAVVAYTYSRHQRKEE